MSCCCTHEEPQFKYQVRSIVQNQQGQHEEIRYFDSLENVDHNTKNDENTSIIKIRPQHGLQTVKDTLAKQKSQFTDETFPPNHSSLGDIPGNIGWRRVPELLKNMSPVIFDKKIEPSDVIAGHSGDCYLLSALAALAQFPDIIKQIFRGQKENPEGIYKINLRVDGVVEEIFIDDNIPVQENGLPVFCQPNKKTGQIWVVLLEKALAKVHGSYANLNEGIPSEIFRAVTYAPSESLVFSNQSEQKQKVWNIMKQYTHNHYPFCATTKQNDSSAVGLERSHTYTIVAAEELHGPRGNLRVVKLRNPWKNVEYRGEGPTRDHQFWNRIEQSPSKTAIISINNNCDYGLFYMLFQDFAEYFNQVHYCNLNKGGKFVSEQVNLTNKASYFDVNVYREDVFTFELNQSKIVGLSKEERQNEGICRATILLIRKEKDLTQAQGYKYQFVNGIMKYNEANTILTEKLVPGSYVVYTKIDPTAILHKFPQTAVLNLYSKSFPELISVPRTKYPALVRNTLLHHAEQNKKSQFCEGKVWMSWQLFYQKGGFAYLAAGNNRDSEHAVVISFNEEQFNALHFKLKKPLKGKGNGQVIRIPPGAQDIIIARVINDPTVKTVKFPPKLDIKLQPLYQ